MQSLYTGRSFTYASCTKLFDRGYIALHGASTFYAPRAHLRQTKNVGSFVL